MASATQDFDTVAFRPALRLIRCVAGMFGMCLLLAGCVTQRADVIISSDDAQTRDVMSQTIELVATRYIDPIGEYRCDDAPPYFTIFIVGHIVVGGALSMEQSMQPSMTLQLSVWLPTTILLCLAFLPFIKGAVLGTQWAMKIKG